MKCWILILGIIGIAIPGMGSVLTAIDSVGIERIGEKSYIIHEVDPQETLFGISRRYGTPVGEIVQSNDNLKSGLKIGQRIRIPFVEKKTIPDGAKLHQVIPGETLFSISKTYQVTVDELMAWNSLQGTDISVGQSLLIKGLAEKEVPVAEEKIEETVELADRKVAVTNEKVTPATEPSDKKATRQAEKAARETTRSEQAESGIPESKPAVSSTGNWISHEVVQGETLFAIARKYDAKVEDLIQWNGLSSNNLRIGQRLKVGRETNAQIPVTQLPGPTEPTADTPPTSNPGPQSAPPQGGSSSSSSSSIDTSTAFKDISENGQAEVIAGTGNHKKYLVLHRTAPVGTIMRIRNEENDVTVFARVVGVLPDTGDNNKLLIKVSKAAFDQLKAVNPRFRVAVSY